MEETKIFPGMKKNILRIGKGMVTLILVWLLVREVDWVGVGNTLENVTLSFIGLYLVLQLVGTWLSAWKWQYLAGTQGFIFSLRQGFFHYLAGAFINNFLPSTIGGDTYRTMWMSEPGKRFEAFGVVLFDRLSGLLALFLLSALSLFFIPMEYFFQQPVLIIVGVLMLGAAIFALFSLISITGFFELVLTIAGFLPWEKVRAQLERLQPLAETTLYLKALGFSFLFLLIGVGLSNWALWQGIGLTLPFGAFLGCIFLATLLANIPISINSIGVKEWSYIFVFGLVGVSAEMAVTAALLSRFLQMLLSFLALPAYLEERKKTAVET